ncbi:MAG: CDP-glucose 4,6-dehydratase [Cyanobium usitatum Tobar12.5m-G36]|nr:CDP-glucose 4,6-dehydratase [Cyanobium usitatum Tobar12.5m-G36]
MMPVSPFVKPDPNFWSGKRVLITGHTGFKGGWLALWLARLGAEVTGVGLMPETSPNLFQLAKIRNLIAKHYIADIRDAPRLRDITAMVRPEIVIHLAAQSLVLAAYENPLGTISTNVLGTANLLNALRGSDGLRVAVMITTDKVYDNPEDSYPFRETDPLGGHDPYSASKAASEIVIACYRKSFLAGERVAVASARAGNVIGGGDWADHRLLPDAVRAWQQNTPLQVRRPEATRPWQHVLDPLSGYICLAERLWADPGLAGSYNFGPNTAEAATVRHVLGLARAAYGHGEIEWGAGNCDAHEATWLSLEVSRARTSLGVSSRWDLIESIIRTMNWYRCLASGSDAASLCSEDITCYEKQTPIAGGIKNYLPK